MDTRAQVAGFKEEMSVLQQQIAEEQEREALWHEQLRQVFFFRLRSERVLARVYAGSASCCMPAHADNAGMMVHAVSIHELFSFSVYTSFCLISLVILACLMSRTSLAMQDLSFDISCNLSHFPGLDTRARAHTHTHTHTDRWRRWRKTYSRRSAQLSSAPSTWRMLTLPSEYVCV